MTAPRPSKQKPLKKKASWAWMFIMALFITELFFYTWCRVRCTQMGYDITQAESWNQKQIKTAYSLRVELASLRSHDRIINKAKTDFGLVLPGPEQIVVMP